MAEWSGAVNTTIPMYVREAFDATMRNYVVFNMIQKKGNVALGESGLSVDWPIQVLEPEVTPHGNGALVDYAPTDLYRRAVLDWRGYRSTDSMTDKDKEMNKSNEAIIKLWSTKIPNLLKKLRRQMGTEFFIDGNATGNENRFHGIESFFGVANSAATNKVSNPSDTYGGLSTAVGQFASNWSANLGTAPNATIAKDWPDGSGDAGYDATSPKPINWSASNWGSGTTTFLANCTYAIRAGHSWTRNTGGTEGAVDAVLLASNLYRDFLNANQTAIRVLAPAKEMTDLGFKAVEFDGYPVIDDFQVPADTGYGLNFDDITLRCLGSQMFRTKGPIWDHNRDAYVFFAGIWGNFTMNPKCHFKLKNYA